MVILLGYGDNLTDKQLILDTWVDTSYLFWLAREASPKEIIVPGLIEVRDHLESNVNFIEFPTHCMEALNFKCNGS